MLCLIFRVIAFASLIITLGLTFWKSQKQQIISNNNIISKNPLKSSQKYALMEDTTKLKYIPIHENDLAITDDTAKFIQFIVKQLNIYADKKYFFIDSILIEGHSQDMIFHQGQLFSSNKHHAVVFFNDFDFFLLKKQNKKWQLLEKIELSGKPLYDRFSTEIKVSPLKFADFNNDGFGDFAIATRSMGGRFSCNSCFILYFYDFKKDRFIRNTEIETYLEVYFDKPPYVYFGNHGYSVEFFKGKFENFLLKKVEGYSFEDTIGNKIEQYGNNYKVNNSTIQVRKHFYFKNNKPFLMDSSKNNKLPKEWETIFKL